MVGPKSSVWSQEHVTYVEGVEGQGEGVVLLGIVGHIIGGKYKKNIVMGTLVVGTYHVRGTKMARIDFLPPNRHEHTTL